MMTDMDRINADYIYCILNEQRMTLSELSSFSRLDTLALARAIECLRCENELMEYTEDGKEYIELKYGYRI